MLARRTRFRGGMAAPALRGRMLGGDAAAEVSARGLRLPAAAACATARAQAGGGRCHGGGGDGPQRGGGPRSAEGPCTTPIKVQEGDGTRSRKPARLETEQKQECLLHGSGHENVQETARVWDLLPQGQETFDETRTPQAAHGNSHGQQTVTERRAGRRPSRSTKPPWETSK